MKDEPKKRCVECGLGEVAWKGNQGLGRILAGEWYCCQGCAEGTNCSCIEQPEEPGEGAAHGANVTRSRRKG